MENELYHWGVKGMKWGVRKDRKNNWSDEAKTASSLKKKKLKEMSNAEIRKLNERTRLENEYRQLNPGAVKKGWKYVGAAVGVMSTIMAAHSGGEKIVKLGKTVGGKIIDSVGDMVMRDLQRHF